MITTALEVSDLYVSYHGKEAVHNLNFSINTGQLVGVVGPNGAGKSTLLKAILSLIPKDKGEIKINGKIIDKVRKQVAYVPQRSQIDWDFPISVLDTVLLGTYPKLGLFKRPKREDKQWAIECLQRVGMEEYSKRQIGELSGGQQQRVFLARALAQQSEILFLDEPFVGIDISSEETIISILKELRDSGNTIFVVHHDLNKAKEYFDQLLLLNKKLIGYGDVETIFSAKYLTEAYQSELSFLAKVGVNI
jgi:ABC-type Mn2+/Zn2+ transport system ATPase subunit